MTKINLKINDIPVSVEEGSTIVDAARELGIKIPTLCHMRHINEIGACRVCVVELKGAKSLVAACVYPVREGMEVYTNTPKVIYSRKMTLELILSDHRKDCLSCERNTNCELQSLSYKYGCNATRFIGKTKPFTQDKTTLYLVRDNSKCILCRRCVAVCRKQQEVGVIGVNDRGFSTHVGCAFDMNLDSVACVGCGQCITVCPTGALKEREELDDVIQALGDPDKIVIVGAAPSVRVALAEEFGAPAGTDCEGKMYTALRYCGFDKIFDVNFAADFTIIEEAYELLNRAENGGKLPMFTSCCPGWIRYVEFNYPELLPNLSTCKSPQQMFGALVKSYFAEKTDIDPKKIHTVAIMPCTAKKFEKTRDGESADGLADIDSVLTTRELAKLLRRNGIQLLSLDDGIADAPLSEYTGAGAIFGATGGVMEAALRTAVEVIDGKHLDALDFRQVRGLDGIKEASYWAGGKQIKVAVANGLPNAKILCDQVKNGKCDYSFIEVMTCPGGCVNGGGQPIRATFVKHKVNLQHIRGMSLYKEDIEAERRKSHENSSVKKIYDEFLGKPNGEKAHKLLHTHYIKREKY